MIKSIITTVVLGLLLCLPQFSMNVRLVLALLAFIIVIILSFTSWCFKSYSLFWSSVQKGFLLFAGVAVFSHIWPIGEYLAMPLLLSHSSENAQAIVVMAGGVNRRGRPTFGGLQRFLHAVELYKSGRAPIIVFSTSELVSTDNFHESAWVASLSKLLNVPEKDIVILKKGRNTYEEAVEVSKYLFDRGIRKILLVTHGPHILRSTMCFKQQGFEVLPAPVHDRNTIDSCTCRGISMLDFAIHEWLGNLWYWVRGRIGFPFFAIFSKNTM